MPLPERLKHQVGYIEDSSVQSECMCRTYVPMLGALVDKDEEQRWSPLCPP